jgi:single-stranded-DNA-specific exonuclease
METSQANQLHPIIIKLLEHRGLNRKEMDHFFSWNLNDIPDLTVLRDLQKASARILAAINSKERIGIYGDYDVDGTTSCALLWHFFEMLGVDVDIFQPSRFVEGYGIHPSSIDNALEKNIKVLITVDCGISNTATADYALNKLDLIITDHHRDAAPELPKAYAVINPCRRDEPEDSPLRALAGVGVAFALALQIKKDLESQGQIVSSIYPLLQFVAIGTISDLARMNFLNMRLTRHGLKQMAQTKYPGIRAFFSNEELNTPMISSEKISFFIGPHINSKGRLDHPERAIRMLIAKNLKEAQEHFQFLEIANRDRKIIQQEVFEEAKKKQIQEIKSDDQLSCILYEPHWHEGVIGIVASKLVETFEIPAFVFTDAEESGVIKASCRSAGDLNIFDLLKSCEEFFIKFGGHKAAAGLSMRKENFPHFKNKMNKLLSTIPSNLRTKNSSFDLEINLEDIDPALVKDLEKLEPFGPGNTRPVFRMKNALVQSYKIMRDIHVRWHFSNIKEKKNALQGISFNYIGRWNELLPEEIYNSQKENGLNVQFTLGINKFQGNETIQLMVEKISLGSI